MRRLVTMSTRRLTALVGAACVLVAGGGIAQAALRNGGTPPPARPLAVAVRDALRAPAPAGVTARIAFTNTVVPSGAVGGDRGATTPLLSGATGRLWMTADGRVRLELQSARGDVQIVSDGRVVRVYDASSNTVYRLRLPAADAADEHAGGPPALAAIRRALARAADAWSVSGAQPGTTGGRPSYTVRLSP